MSTELVRLEGELAEAEQESLTNQNLHDAYGQCREDLQFWREDSRGQASFNLELLAVNET